MRSMLYHILNKENKKGSYTFLNTLIRANSLIIKVLTRSFIMLNAMIENESQSFTDISIFLSFLWDLGGRSWHLFSFLVIVYTMIYFHVFVIYTFIPSYQEFKEKAATVNRFVIACKVIFI